MLQKLSITHFHKLRFLVLIVLFLAIKTTAQTDSSSLFFKNYSTTNGLSDNHVNCIIKDVHGFIWIATDNGLNRFDGTNFKNFKNDINDSLSLACNRVTYLSTDSEDNLWIATWENLCKYDYKTQTFKRYEFQSQNDSSTKQLKNVRCYLDSRKNFWITYSTTLILYDNVHDSLIEYPLPAKINPRGIVSITEGLHGNIWLTCFKDLFVFDIRLKTFKYFSVTIIENGVERHIQLNSAIHFDPTDTNHVWLGSWGDGLVYLNTSTFAFKRFKFKTGKPFNVSNIVFQVEKKEDGKLWVLNEGVPATFDTRTHTFTFIASDNANATSLPDKQTQCMYIENNNRTWFGHVNGLSLLDKSLQLFSAIKIGFTKVSGIMNWDALSQHYYGLTLYTNRSLFIYNKAFSTITKYPMSFLDKSITEPLAVLKNDEGVWIGTWKDGIYFFNETTKQFTHVFNNLESDSGKKISITYILKDFNNYLWFSCFSNKLMCYNPTTKKFLQFPVINQKGDTANVIITKIIELDKDHLALLFGSVGYGIFNKTTLITATFLKDDKHLNVFGSDNDLIKTMEGRLFLISRENGIAELVGNSYISYNTIGDEPIKDLFYSGICDNLNNIWIGSSNGLYRFNMTTKTFFHYSLAYGLNGKVFYDLLSSGAQEIITRNEDMIYKFNPYDFIEEEKLPTLYFVSIKANGISPIGNADLNYLKRINVTHEQNNFSIQFGELNFTNPGNSVFEYQLEGADKHWTIANKNFNVNYSALPPGNYIFKVRSKTSNGKSVSNEIRLLINIIPAWWQTWWYKILTASLILCTTFYIARTIFLLRYRQKIAVLERQNEIEKVRSRIARDIHDDIGAGITKITLMARNATKSSNTKTENAVAKDKINHASKELIQQLGEIIWTVNPDNDSIQNYFAFVRHYLNKQFDDTAINLQLEIPKIDEENKLNLNPEIRRNTLLILKEAINNALKYADAKNISVKFILKDHHLELAIDDDGIGYVTSPPTSFTSSALRAPYPKEKENRGELGGNGLKNMRKRADEMKAELKMESFNGSGTAISLRVPL